MTTMPEQPKVYHITHARNLSRIVADGALWSDAVRIASQFECEVVGMSSIKRRRLEEIDVDCYPGSKVGEYVPFYFCPRSIMLYILHMGNHMEVTYKGGQRPIVHLQADLRSVVAWADEQGIDWAFTDGNAGAYLANFYSSFDDLPRVNWRAVDATDFRDPLIKEGKQAEFLIRERFPWELVEKIGVVDQAVAGKVNELISGVEHRPAVTVERSWYY